MKLRMIGSLGIAVSVLAVACSSSDDPSPTGSSSSSSGASGASAPASAASGCKVTFGGDAKTVTAKSCSQMGPYTSDATAFEWHGDAEGLDAPIYSFTVKYPNGVTAKTYETKDISYVSSNIGVTSTGKNYYVDFDAADATKERHGSVTTKLTSDQHGTVDIVFESDDTPPQQATAHIDF